MKNVMFACDIHYNIYNIYILVIGIFVGFIGHLSF